MAEGATFDLFSTAVMLKAVEQMPRVYTFLSDMFCQDGDVLEDDNVMYDYRKGTRTGLAPFVVPGTGGVPVNRQGYEMRQIGFTTVAPERVVTLADISGRMFGEKVMGAMTPEQRAKKVLARDLTYLRTMVQNRRNWMALQMLLYGKMSIRRWTNEGLEKYPTTVADFGFTQVYNPNTKWDQPGAKIDDDLRTVFDMVYDGGGEVDIIVMSPDVFSCMLANSEFAKTLDMRNVNMGEINTRYRGQGVRALGFNSDGVEMFSYSGKFLDEDHTVKPCLPSGTIIVGSSRNKPLKMLHGPITKVTGKDESAKFTTYIKKEVPFRIGDSNSDSITTRLMSRPTIVPENVDAWAVMKVL